MKRGKKEVEIGAKVEASASPKHEKVIPNDGHKFFNAIEARSMAETLKQENLSRSRFEERKSKLIVPRNPIMGDQTPRKEIDYNYFEIKGGDGTFRRVDKIGSLKLGVSDKIGFRGEHIHEKGSPSFCNMARIESLRNLQDNISENMELLRVRIAEKDSLVKMSLMKNRQATMKKEPSS